MLKIDHLFSRVINFFVVIGLRTTLLVFGILYMPTHGLGFMPIINIKYPCSKCPFQEPNKCGDPLDLALFVKGSNSHV